MDTHQKTENHCEQCKLIFLRRKDSQAHSFSIFNKILCIKCSRAIVSKKMWTSRKRTLSEECKQKMLETRRKKYPPLTLNCKCCHKEFTVPYGRRDAIYCGRSCQSKSVTHTDIRKTSVCKVCSKDFKHYGERIVCSTECLSAYMSEMRLGENNPNFKSRKDFDASSCAKCGKSFSYSRAGLHTGQKRLFCSLKCSRSLGGGLHLKNKEQYILKDVGGAEFLEYISSPYPRIWKDKLKNKIKQRDGNKCVFCESSHPLEVHHIDYNKQNCGEENLITLCKKCHTITHHNRYFWQQVFNGLITGSKIVKKGWGLEIHLVNNDKYCLKYLVFFKGKSFSLHSHRLKHETFIVNGNLECFLSKDGLKDEYLVLKTGDKVEIEPGTVHQLRALTNSIITEVSTTDYPEDSIRVEKGD